jgi:hypothetical protein
LWILAEAAFWSIWLIRFMVLVGGSSFKWH